MNDLPERQFSFHGRHWWDDWNKIRDDDWPDDLEPMSLAIMFDGFCPCGSPEDVVNLMAQHLLTYAQRFPESNAKFVPHPLPDVDKVLVYWADKIGFTIHGGSVFSAWLEPAGERWLELWERDHDYYCY